MTLKILFIGDTVGKVARKALQKALPDIKKSIGPDVIIANGENATHGSGITLEHYNELRALGIDLITLGDHAFDRKQAANLLEKEKMHILRPANYPPDASGQGETVIECGTKKILVINLLGRVFMKMNYDCPFRTADALLKKYERKKIHATIVDFHAEASSEKNAMGWHLDGRVSAVLGTHTHIPTADAKILPQGTAYVSDTGMVGAKDSVIGVKKDAALRGFLTQIPQLLEPLEEGMCLINSVLLEINPKTQKAISIKRLDKEIDV